MEDERGRRRDEMRKTGKEMTKNDTVDVQPRSPEDPNKREEVCVCAGCTARSDDLAVL